MKNSIVVAVARNIINFKKVQIKYIMHIISYKTLYMCILNRRFNKSLVIKQWQGQWQQGSQMEEREREGNRESGEASLSLI